MIDIFISKLMFFFIGMGIFLGLSACSDSGVDAPVGDVSVSTRYFIVPNVNRTRDSIDVRINKGIGARLSPGGRYSLFAKVDSLDVEPFLFVDGITCCEDGCLGIREEYGLRFDFSCEMLQPTRVALSLKNRNGDVLNNSFYHVRLDGVGVYSSELSLNVIVAGAFDSTADGESIDVLARNIGTSIQDLFEVRVDTVYVSYANEHPIVGHLYPKNNPLFIQSLSDVDDLRNLWGNLKRDNAFDIVLVDGFRDNSGGQSISFFYQTDLDMDVIAVGFRDMNGALVKSQQIQHIAAHEFGHVVGLVHTTLTLDELQDWADFSLFDDGLDDSPSCQDKIDKNKLVLKEQGLMKRSYDFDGTDFYQLILDPCPDYSNIMYYTGSGRESSPMQRAIVKKNLTLIPH